MFITQCKAEDFFEDYDDVLKKRFLKQGKKLLKQLAQELKLPEGYYDISSNQGGSFESGEVTLHSEHAYINVHKNNLTRDILYRRCEGRKDYTGGRNHFADINALNDLRKFALIIKRDLGFIIATPALQDEISNGMSIWGAIQTSEIVADGIRIVGTASHGGIILSEARNKQVPEYMRRDDAQYEEDCACVIPFLVFEQEFQSWYETKGMTDYKARKEAALKDLKKYQPEAYALWNDPQKSKRYASLKTFEVTLYPCLIENGREVPIVFEISGSNPMPRKTIKANTVDEMLAEVEKFAKKHGEPCEACVLCLEKHKPNHFDKKTHKLYFNQPDKQIHPF